MQIHNLTLAPKKSRKRIGRGGKRGTYSGRGGKGQTARSGGNVDPLFEGGRSSLTERLKKYGGFKSPHLKSVALTLGQLAASFPMGGTITVESLRAAKLLRKKDEHRGVKILSGGDIPKGLEIAKGIKLSDSAKTAIEKAGGKVL